jgi:hypothetical protein
MLLERWKDIQVSGQALRVPEVGGSTDKFDLLFCQILDTMKSKAILPAQWLSIGFRTQRSVVRLQNVSKKGLRFL